MARINHNNLHLILTPFKIISTVYVAFFFIITTNNPKKENNTQDTAKGKQPNNNMPTVNKVATKNIQFNPAVCCMDGVYFSLAKQF